MTSSRKAFAVLGAAWLLLCGGFALAAADAPADAPPARAEPPSPVTMRRGTVDESWAKEHHEIWYHEVKAAKSRQHYAL